MSLRFRLYIRRIVLCLSLLPLMAFFQNCAKPGFQLEDAASDPSGQGVPTPSTVTSTTSTTTTLPGSTSTTVTSTTTSTTLATTTTTQAPNPVGLFITLPSTGTVDVTLHPAAQAVGGAQTIFFAIPFPKNAVSNANQIRVLDAAGVEIPSQVSVINSWRSLTAPATALSIRSVQIIIQRTFANTNSQVVRVQYGQARTQNLSGSYDIASTWQSISNGPNPSEFPSSVMEPKIYATLPASWMSSALLQTRTTPANSIATYNWFDNSFLTHSSAAFTYNTSEPWLYDRAQTYFIAYFRTGDVTRLRRAHRSAQYYKSQIQSNGDFALKAGDAKYVYGSSMSYDLMLTGDLSLIPVIERTTQPHSGWPTNFSASTGFWTERNSAYALLAALAAFDVTGNANYATRARNLFADYFRMQQTPGNGWPKIGCTLHTRNQHDPEEDIPDVMCSPWMGALLAEAVWKYYLFSLDNNALIYLADFARYISQYGLVTEGGRRLPYYAASHLGNTDDGDIEHACDVLGAMTKGYWAMRMLSQSSTNVQSDMNALVSSCQANLSSSSLSPPRKYSWWFGTNSDFAWFLTNLP